VHFLASQPPVSHGLFIHEVSRSHTTTHHIWYDFSGRVISSSQSPLPDNTQHSQQTNIHASGGNRTQDISWRTAVDLHLRPRGQWDRQLVHCFGWNMKGKAFIIATRDFTHNNFSIFPEIVIYFQHQYDSPKTNTATSERTPPPTTVHTFWSAAGSSYHPLFEVKCVITSTTTS